MRTKKEQVVLAVELRLNFCLDRLGRWRLTRGDLLSDSPIFDTQDRDIPAIVANTDVGVTIILEVPPGCTGLILRELP